MSFVPEMAEHGTGAFSVRVPRFSRWCSAECEAASAKRADDEKRADAARFREEMASRDPEEVLLKAGFVDQELFGCHLGNFDRSTKLLDDRWKVAYDFAAGKSSAPALSMLGFAGRGKTHLARGIARSWIKQGREVRYFTLIDIIARCKRLMNSGAESPDEYISWIGRFNGLVIIDELGRSGNGSWVTNSVLYPLVSQRKDRPTVFISNVSLEHLADYYDEAVSSRLSRSEVIWFPEEMKDFRLEKPVKKAT